MKPARILLVAPSADAASTIEQALTDRATLTHVTTAAAALEQLRAGPWDLLLLVLTRGNRSAIELLPSARQIDADLPAILVGAEPELATATARLPAGTAEYLDAALAEVELGPLVDRLWDRRRLRAEHQLLRHQLERDYGFDEFIGTSLAMRKVFATIEQVAQSDVDVLVVGPTGTGKELVARSIHRRSRRAERPFVPVDCGAIPENLLESEFFGHERGAFTGADRQRLGLLEFADGGTLFLDELGELPLLLQAKLLRTLQERKIRRIGGREEIDVDVRVVAATARDLPDMIRQRSFRQDLYYRIHVVQIDLPPLAERGDDVGLLTEYFAVRASREAHRPLVGITPEAFQVLSQYPWPGNVRELQNVIRRGVALSRDTMLGLDDLPDELIRSAGRRETAGGSGYFQLRDEHLARFEREYLSALLTRHQGDVKAAAAEAQLPRGTLYRLMKQHGLESGQFRK